MEPTTPDVPTTPAPPTPPKPWWKRKWGIATIVVVGVLILGGIGSAMNPKDAGSTPSAAPSSDTAVATATPTAAPTDEATEDPSTEPTAEPTEEATSEPTAEPTPAASAPATILKAKGSGDKIVKLAAQEEPTIAKITAKGGGNFAVISYAGSDYDDLLVNEVGSYSGTVYVAAGVTRFKITSSGTWTIEVKPVTASRHWDGSSALTGKGDNVVILTGGASGITTIKNKSRSNFAVIAYTLDGDYLDLIVNEIGNYNGEVLLPDEDTMVLTIHAVGGTWSMSRVEQ